MVIRKDAGDVDGYFNELFVTQHDLLRDLAIYKSQESNLIQNKRLVMDRREDDLPKIWEEHKDQVFEAQIVSIHTGYFLILDQNFSIFLHSCIHLRRLHDHNCRRNGYLELV